MWYLSGVIRVFQDDASELTRHSVEASLEPRSLMEVYHEQSKPTPSLVDTASCKIKERGGFSRVPENSDMPS